MATTSSQRGAAEKLTLPLMVFSFVIVAGFLYWLSITAEPTQIAVEEDTGEEAAVDATLSQDEFLANPNAFVGQRVRVTGMRVASYLGTQAFWAGPDENPYLVKLGPALVEAGTAVLTEQILQVVGTVHEMNDSVLNAWDSLGVFQSEGDRVVAEFATTFIEAEQVGTETGAGGGGDQAGGAGGTAGEASGG